jgi:hypothetical protein
MSCSLAIGRFWRGGGDGRKGIKALGRIRKDKREKKGNVS